MLAYVSYLFYVSMSQMQFYAYAGDTIHPKVLKSAKEQFAFKYSKSELALLQANLVDVQKINSNLKVDLAYATNNNFTKSILYADIKRAFLQMPIAEKLNKAQQFATELDSTLSIVVLDAARPQSVQLKMWEWAKAEGKTRYVASPWKGSIHNYGCAVDATLMRGDSLLDMGTVYDYFGEAAEPRYQWQLLKEGKLTQAQIDNRQLLKKVMKAGGFYPILTEWWHFNGLSKDRARQYYEIIE